MGCEPGALMAEIGRMDSVGYPLFMLDRVVNMVDCFWRTVKTAEG